MSDDRPPRSAGSTDTPPGGEGERDATVEGHATVENPVTVEAPATVEDPVAVDDDSLTILVGAMGGLVIGLAVTAVALFATGSSWAFGVGGFAWVLATAYLARRRTAPEAIATTGFAVASVLLLVPAIALSPATVVEGRFDGPGTSGAVLFLFVGVPAVLAVVLALVATRFVRHGAPKWRS